MGLSLLEVFTIISWTMFQFRDYQQEIMDKGVGILEDAGFLYLAMEVRTGKTLTSLGICDKMNVNNVLFLTKKKAISSISDDYTKLCPASFSLFTINYESIHRAPDIEWDIVILDEAHGLGAFPKPSGRTKKIKDLLHKNGSKVILLSGTPTPESYSQMYHQVYGIKSSPFSKHKNFYSFAKEHVKIFQRLINGRLINDYSNGLKTIVHLMKPYTISYTQKEAGFKVETKETVLVSPMHPDTESLINLLKENLVAYVGDSAILADTPVKLMQKVHQMCSGTVKFEDGKSTILDVNKALYVSKYFKGKKIGIFYKFKEELNALRKVFGDNLCTTLEEFNNSNKNIALQIVSGREGISLREAECLVFYNIDFSATSYWQARDRMTTKDRLKNDVYWVFSEGGIEESIYETVKSKKDFTLHHFKRQLF